MTKGKESSGAHHSTSLPPLGTRTACSPFDKRLMAILKYL